MTPPARRANGAIIREGLGGPVAGLDFVNRKDRRKGALATKPKVKCRIVNRRSHWIDDCGQRPALLTIQYQYGSAQNQ
jgi:hypothetical protein